MVCESMVCERGSETVSPSLVQKRLGWVIELDMQPVEASQEESDG